MTSEVAETRPSSRASTTPPGRSSTVRRPPASAGQPSGSSPRTPMATTTSPSPAEDRTFRGQGNTTPATPSGASPAPSTCGATPRAHPPSRMTGTCRRMTSSPGATSPTTTSPPAAASVVPATSTGSASGWMRECATGSCLTAPRRPGRRTTWRATSGSTSTGTCAVSARALRRTTTRTFAPMPPGAPHAWCIRTGPCAPEAGSPATPGSTGWASPPPMTQRATTPSR